MRYRADNPGYAIHNGTNCPGNTVNDGANGLGDSVGYCPENPGEAVRDAADQYENALSDDWTYVIRLWNRLRYASRGFCGSASAMAAAPVIQSGRVMVRGLGEATW